MVDTEQQGKRRPLAGQQLQQQPVPAAPTDTGDPDAAAAAIMAAITADIGEPLAAGCRARPQLFIGDLFVGPTGGLLPAAEQQLAVLSVLFQRCAGELLEVYGYYALLGCSAHVVADRLAMDLRSLGKLAHDLHISQDSRSLSAVEDVFYLLSDRRPCLALQSKTRPSSAAPTSSRSGHGASSSTTPDMLLNGAAAAAAVASDSAYLEPGAQHAAARAAAPEWTRRDRAATSNAAAVAAAAIASAFEAEVILPEQFPEALIRLACVRYRWGVINEEYDWDDESSNYSDGDCEEDACSPEKSPVSPRMNRLVQQQKMQQQQQSKRKRGPKVLRPEGRGLHDAAPSAVALRSTTNPAASRSRPPSPGRAGAPDYRLPTAADDLVEVVRTFLQHEVLKCARRNRLAGSPLGLRRAQTEQPHLMGWEALPHGALRD
ncbi:hypothetical protein COO60DRAFT_1478400 [Scenedesmus sp. NREL 46B-D3]|nr:hypothetical protein COO60DRAFT_1478400 [Scenedesmus sp. NREL 46B-D3]